MATRKKSATKKAPGRKPYKPTAKDRRFVKTAASGGIQQLEIAKALGMDAKTLRKHFRHELDVAMVEANATVIGALYKGAIKGGAAQQIFWAKCRMGWKETSVHELGGVDGGDIPVVHRIIFEDNGRDKNKGPGDA